MAERATRWCLQLAFWGPLALCSGLAIMPSPPEAVFRVGDVLLHAFAFTYLTFAFGLAFERLRLMAVAAIMLSYGVLLELAQGLGGARHAELKDIGVDLGGIALGLLLLVAVGSWSRRTVAAVLRWLLPLR